IPMMGYYTNYSRKVEEMSQRYLLNGSLDDPDLFWKIGPTQEVKTFLEDDDGILKCYSNNLHLYQSGLKPQTREIDESRLQLLRADSRIRVRRKPHEARTHVVKNALCELILVRDWDVFTRLGQGPLVKMKQSWTGNSYFYILRHQLQRFMNFMNPENDGISQYVNAPYRRAKIIRDWIVQHSGQFQRMIWPPGGSDMNSIHYI
ncbi:hypothetical protein AVEN_28253-1, partial [Araneus ventricosus]